jgi:thiol-disulfide isomerase/thioredoxin
MNPALRVVMLGVAALAVVAVGLYALTGGDGAETPSAPESNLPFGGTPLPELPGMPTLAAGTGPVGPDRPEVGKPAPDFALYSVYDGTTLHSLSDFRGQPVVLNWYASWCGPCRAELPTYQAAQDALGDEVVFFAVNLIEDTDRALGMLEELDISFPAVLDPSGSVSDRWRISQMPTTYFIGADGTVVAQHIGPVSEGQLVELLAGLAVDYVPANQD